MEKEDDLEEIKKRLRSYKKEQIMFNEPHFTQQLILREGNREEVVRNMLDPKNLVYSYHRKDKYNKTRHCLHFKMSSKRTMRIPAILNKKSLYILTYIVRYRPWQSMMRRK